MKRIIIDFDNTMGLNACDVDDGLALLYLLGCDDASVEGICTTYGNNRLDAVHANTLRIAELWGLEMPILRGSEAPMGDVRDTFEAADFLIGKLQAEPGEFHVLGTGSTTNLGCAQLLGDSCLASAASITLMGGITESLIINGRAMDELNLSCDPAATCAVLGCGAPCAVLTANNCLPAFFTRDDLIAAFGEGSWVYRTCDNWFRTMDGAFSINGWTCWDVVAAAHLMHPELFEEHRFDVTLYERLIGAGFLELDRLRDGESFPTGWVDLPTIADVAAFKQHVMETWQRGAQRIGLE